MMGILERLYMSFFLSAGQSKSQWVSLASLACSDCEKNLILNSFIDVYC